MRAVIIGGLNARNNQPPLPKNNSTTSTTRNPRPNPNLNVTTTSARLSSTQPSDRLPLQSRDNNAMMRGSQKGGLSTRSGISSDNKPASRPLMPTLSASAKAPIRPALAPRVAGSATGAPIAPLRRTPRPVVRSNTPESSREELPTPLSSYLTNITPRSGPRKVRVDGGSSNSTPSGTPTGTPGFPPTNDSFRAAQDATMHGSGLSISAMDRDRDTSKRATISFSTAGSEVGGYRRSPNAASADSKFFFASDVKPAQPARAGLQSNKSSSNFFYASGESIPPAQSTASSVVGSTVGEERSQPKFFHANGTPDLQLSPSPSFAPSRPVSVVSSRSRMTVGRASTFSSGTLSPPQKTASAKLQHANIPSQRSTPILQAAVAPRSQVGGRGQSTNNGAANRRTSLENPRVVSHGRSASVGSGPPSRKNSVSSPMEVTSPTTPSHIIPAGLISTPEEAQEETPETSSIDGDVTSENSQSPQSPQNPIKVGQTLEQLNELAAKARRERKVLDLEITNSSLEAINRTLEREMRKQTAELRRFRRLSRSGRLSIAPISLRTSMDTLSVIGESFDGASLSGLSDDEDLDYDEIEEEGFSDTSESMDDGTLSPAAIAESDLKHRKKDEKRLQKELSKHQQLLIDSQKMNQSLKRCLGWTEALIDEGKKALEYRVIPADVELGGRVLTQDEIERQQEAETDNEGMSDIGARMLREARQKAAANAANAAASWGGEGKEDRDSGIEIDGTHREALRVSFGSPIL